MSDQILPVLEKERKSHKPLDFWVFSKKISSENLR